MEDDDYTWFYNKNNDKIGISLDAKYMMHDGMINEITLYKRTRTKDGDILKLIYTLNNQKNLMLQTDKTYLYFCYSTVNGKKVFDHLGFNHGEYR